MTNYRLKYICFLILLIAFCNCASIRKETEYNKKENETFKQEEFSKKALFCDFLVPSIAIALLFFSQEKEITSQENWIIPAIIFSMKLRLEGEKYKEKCHSSFQEEFINDEIKGLDALLKELPEKQAITNLKKQQLSHTQ